MSEENSNLEVNNTVAPTEGITPPTPAPVPTPTPTPPTEVAPSPEVLEPKPSYVPTFNEELPDGLKGNTALEGVFRIAKAQFPDMDLNRVMGRAWETGDPQLVDYNYLAEVAGEDFAKYYGEYFSGIIESHVAETSQELESWATGVFDSVGGKQNWDRIAGAFNSNFPQMGDHVRALLNDSDAGNRDLGVQIILNMVRPLGITPKSGGKAGALDNITPANVGGTALNSQQFMEEVAKLSNSGSLDPNKLNELRQRRMAGVRAGLK